MATFPALAAKPSIREWEETRSLDPTLRHEADGGYVVTGARFTRTPPKKYHIKIDPLSQAEKTSLEALENEVKVGAGIFPWTNPFTGTVLDVRFMAPLKFRPWGNLPGAWSVEFDIEEV